MEEEEGSAAVAQDDGVENGNEASEETTQVEEVLQVQVLSPRTVGTEASWDGFPNDTTQRRTRIGLSSMSPGGTERINRLYEYGKEARRRRRQSTGRSPFDQGCTFKPKINNSRPPPPPPHSSPSIPPASSSSAPTSPSSQPTLDKVNRFQQLYEQGLLSKARMEEMRKIALEASCPTFTPKINKQVPQSPASTDSNKSRFEWLYEEAQSRKEQLQRKQETSQDAECTFEPKLMSKYRSDKAHEKTGKDRLESLYMQAKRLEEKRKKVLEMSEKQYTFKPKINRYHSKSCAASDPGDGVVRRGISRMSPGKEELERRQERLEEIRKAREMQGCTFAPQLLTSSSPSSIRKRVDSSTTSASRTAVYDRLYEDAKLKKRSSSTVSSPLSPKTSKSTSSDSAKTFERLYREGKEQASRKKRDEKLVQERREKEEWERNRQECTFAPSIGKASRALADKVNKEKSKLLSTSNGDIFERLYKESSIKTAKQELVASDGLGLGIGAGLGDEYTFSPRINETSRAIAARQIEEARQLRQARKHFTFMRKGQFSPTNEEIYPTEQELNALGGPEGLFSVDESSSSLRSPNIGEEPFAAMTQAQEDALANRLEKGFGDENVEFLSQLVEEDLGDEKLSAFRESSWQVGPLID